MKIWSIVGVVAFVAAAIALAAGRFGLGAALLIACVTSLGAAMRRHRRGAGGASEG
ncbi:hypothetical protein [Okibacterium endophyticum]